VTPHQKDMLVALGQVPEGTEFCAGDMSKLYGYPHDDAAKVLQQDFILMNFLDYADPSYRGGKIRYLKLDTFEDSVAGYRDRTPRTQD
jgi:hypothetical protein